MQRFRYHQLSDLWCERPILITTRRTPVANARYCALVSLSTFGPLVWTGQLGIWSLQWPTQGWQPGCSKAFLRSGKNETGNKNEMTLTAPMSTREGNHPSSSISQKRVRMCTNRAI
ncbi:uncharacterized protein LOC124326653 [Daphnia pulicaria]|uniref:uncharacterized protein LOC124326653 n=1 Tax=Daphnia pulicaria TaxID=35523 RepID=UPI001EEB28D9|nr:uncharacterized protein LOC124326653 [Daphnia pulicaria]